jgi:hypothetical protein
MFVYRYAEPGLWTVGHYDPKGKWVSESDHGSKDEAASRVIELHGGVKAGPPLHVQDFVGVAEDQNRTGRWCVMLFTRDGQGRVLEAVGRKQEADELARRIRDCLATWPGWVQAPRGV